MEVLVAIDAGTTGVRAISVGADGQVQEVCYRELTQHYPAPGLVEHDPDEIWRLVETTLSELAASLRAEPTNSVVAIGLTNQRETAVAWSRRTGKPLHRAIAWQDRRTARRCRELEASGLLPFVRERTGLVLDPYFSATKWEWMMSQGGLEVGPDLLLGTVDDWICWNLTGGPAGGVHATDVSNASRTLCYDIVHMAWSEQLCDTFGIPMRALGDVLPSSGRFGVVSREVAGGLLAGVPLSGIAGDQQAALFGQCCFEIGMTKVTYGTGGFVLMNLGPRCPKPADGLLTTVAWEVSGETSYALEGAIFSAGATVQWLRDGLGIIGHVEELAPLAETVDSSQGVVVVPALTGMGSPWWDPEARGTIVGLSRGTGRAHLARAVVESIAFRTRDVLESMASASGHPVTELRADGGAAGMSLLLQMLADQSQLRVGRQQSVEVTALGAAMLAGLAEGVWASPSDLRRLAPADVRYEPRLSQTRVDHDYERWLDALRRSRGWALSLDAISP
ncbi:MAG: FGGY family carbohydrate kinase [Acidimicrobiales bacterium]